MYEKRWPSCSKFYVRTVDDIVKMCFVFLYPEDDIPTARSILEQVLPYRVSKRQEANKCQTIMDDLIKQIFMRAKRAENFWGL